MILGEIQWKLIKGYEHQYAVSEYGDIKNILTGRLKKPQVHRDGYLSIGLYKDRKFTCFLIHRLVAEVFIPNELNYPQVNHKDLDKKNNHYFNLEWCTHLMNMQHLYGIRKIPRYGVSTDKHKEVMKKFRKPVYAYSVSEKELITFESHKSCAKHFGLLNSSISSSIIMNSKVRGKYSLFHEKEWQSFAKANNIKL